MNSKDFPFLELAIKEANRRKMMRRAAIHAWIIIAIELIIEWAIIALIYHFSPIAGVVVGILSLSVTGYRLYKSREVLKDLVKLTKYGTTFIG